jgi:ribosome biogenesis protein Nip4
MIHNFIKQFTEKKIEGIIKIANRYYLAEEGLLQLKNSIKLEPEGVGLYLGEETKKGFKPSPALIDEIAKISDRKIFVNHKAEMLFLCGRDIFEKSVIKFNTKEGIILVQNERDENLGYGNITLENNKVIINNLLDKGIYLRSEMDKIK